MFRAGKTLGTALIGIGVAMLVVFAGFAVAAWLGDFQKARLFAERNPGNAMYDLQYFIAASRLGFLLIGAAGGLLLALNGTTLVLLGKAVEAQHRSTAMSEREA